MRIYQLGEDKLLAARISARTADWEEGTWRLQDVEHVRVPQDEALVEAAPSAAWKTNLRPDDVRRAEVARPSLSSSMLMDVIGGAEAIG